MYLKTAAPVSTAAAQTPIDGRNRAASPHTGASIVGVSSIAPERIRSASAARPVYPQDERSRAETHNSTATHPRTPSGSSPQLGHIQGAIKLTTIPPASPPVAAQKHYS